MIANKTLIKISAMEDNYGISVTSYEKESARATTKRPVLTHIFWGETFEEALGNASAHLITDYFFSSSLVGKMKWRDGFLYLETDTAILRVKGLQREKEDIEGLLRAGAQKTNKAQIKAGIDNLLKEILARTSPQEEK